MNLGDELLGKSVPPKQEQRVKRMCEFGVTGYGAPCRFAAAEHVNGKVYCLTHARVVKRSVPTFSVVMKWLAQERDKDSVEWKRVAAACKRAVG